MSTSGEAKGAKRTSTRDCADIASGSAGAQGSAP